MKLFIGKLGIVLGEGNIIGIGKECEDGKYRGRAIKIEPKNDLSTHEFERCERRITPMSQPQIIESRIYEHHYIKRPIMKNKMDRIENKE